MKRVIVVISALMFVAGASAQESTVEVVSGDNRVDVVSIRPDERNNEVCVTIAGYDMVFGGRSMAKVKKAKTRYRGHIGLLDFGFNALSGVSYTGYTDAERGFMDLNNARSIYVGVTPFSFSMPINASRTLGFSAGLGIVWRDYAFENNLTLIKADGTIRPAEIDHSVKKSKLSTFSVKVPVMLECNFGKFYVSGGLYGDLILGSHTKYKFPKEKDKSVPYINMFQAGASTKFGYRNVYLFGDYAFTTLFKSDRGPSAHPVTVGFGFKM